MNLRIPKRTKQIDDSREKFLGYATDGSSIHTTVNAHLLNGNEKDQLGDNLINQVRQGAVEKAVAEVQHGAAAFLEHSVLQLAPPVMLDSYRSDQKAFWDWFTKSGFGFKQDGLKSVFLVKGQEMASITAKCDPTLKDEVEIMLKFEHIMAQSKGLLQ